MLGRQEMLVDAGSLRKLMEEFGIHPGSDLLAELLTSCDGGYGEPFLRLLGASEIVSIDASAYEGCTFSHDLNLPIPECLKDRFDLLIDGGTLEHIFNFPVAIQNCIDMLTLGGHFLSATPANNFAGHGFYQFSPELFFRVFSPENGFVIERAIVSEAYCDKSWYRVPDPQQVRSRVEFVSAHPTYLLIQAKKVRQFDVIQRYPQQSDYSAIWQGQGSLKRQPEPSQLRRKTFRGTLGFILKLIPGVKQLAFHVHRNRVRRQSINRLLDGPDGKFLEECDKGAR